MFFRFRDALLIVLVLLPLSIFPAKAHASAFNFTLTAVPAALSITSGGPGGVETVDATITAGIASPITFSILSLPPGVTSSPFNPGTCSPSCSSTVTLTATSTAPCSSTIVTIQAVGGGVTQTTTFTLDVLSSGGGGGSFDFCLAATPATLTISPGSSADETIATGLVSGVSGPVAFSLTSSLPPGVSISAFNPSSCSPACSTIVNFTVNANAPGSTTIVTIQGSGGGVTHTVTFSLVVVFDFSLGVGPKDLTIPEGGTGGVETATATLISGISTPVTFSITTPLPTGVTASVFSPASCSVPCSANVTFTASASAPDSLTTIQIQAAGGGVTRTDIFALFVRPPGFNFVLFASTVFLLPGHAPTTASFFASLTGSVTAPVTFNLTSPLPSGVTASPITPNTCSPSCNAYITFTASPTAPISNTTMTVLAVGGNLTRTASFNIVVECGFGGSSSFDFCLTASPRTLALVQGGPSANETATARLEAGTGTPVSFSLSTPLPSGVTGSFAPASCNPTCSANITLTAAASASACTPADLTIQAVGGGLTRTFTFTLVVSQGSSGGFDFCLVARPATLALAGGGGAGVETATATIISGVSIPVTFSLVGQIPSGISIGPFTPSSCGPTCSASVNLTASATTPTGTTVITIQATGGGITRTTLFSLTILASSFNFGLSASPAALSITPGGPAGIETATTTLISGVSTPVTFSVSGLPAGVTAGAFSPSSCSPSCTATVTLTASPFAPGGSTSVTITAVGGGLTHTTTFTLTIPVCDTFGLAASPATLFLSPGGTGGIETVTATSLGCTSMPPLIFSIVTTLPTGVTASAFTPSTCSPTCSATVTFTASGTTPDSSNIVTIQAVSGSVTLTTTFTLVVIFGPFDFSLAVTPSTLLITEGGAGGVETALATLTGGVPSPVTFSITTALPSGVTVSAFAPALCTPSCTATVTLTASTSATISSTLITLQAVGGGVTHTASFMLKIGVGDSDDDGIPDNMDCGVVGFSNCFSDIPLGGTTSGTILSRGDQCPSIPCQLTFTEVSPSAGILITSGSAGGLTPASISVCSGASVISVPASTSLTVKCGTVTITVLTGAVGLTFVGTGSQLGVTGTASVIGGNSVTFDPTTFGFTAPATNASPILVTIEGQTVIVTPGQTTSSPFTQFVITVVSPKGEVFAAGAVLKFDGRTSFATVGPITNFVWNFGDGVIDTHNVAKLTHTYGAAGMYTVTLTVTDNFGKSNSQSQTINVLPAPLIGSVTFSQNLFVSGDRLTQNVTVEVTNPNSFPILVSLAVAGNCDTACPFNVHSDPVLVGPGQTVFVSVAAVLIPLDQGLTFNMLVILSFTENISNKNINTYDTAATETLQFTIK